MKQSKRAVSKLPLIAVVLGITASAPGQESRTYSETFKVNPDVVVALNTSHADIEFETWNRNEVVVEATVALEGATGEEARAFFERGGVEILGNSGEVRINTRPDALAPLGFSGPLGTDLENLEVVIPDLPELAPMLEELMVQVPEMAEMPPMPPVPFSTFDYEAYRKEGDAYLREWKREFEKEFDAESRARFEAWSREARARAEELRAGLEEREAARSELREALEKQREELARQREALRARVAQAREQEREAREQAREARVSFKRGEGAPRNFSIKRTIHVKMPKGARLKLNVRHGEVRLAESALNTKATLSYARLLASTIDGKDTFIEARYSPVVVRRWEGGRLQADFSEGVRLNEVGQLRLQATSSDVTIDRLLRQASIENRLGALQIGAVAEDFRDVAITVENGELNCRLPQSAYRIHVSNHRSRVTYPDFIRWDPAGTGMAATRDGVHGAGDSGRSVRIDAAFSEVTLRE